jgi:inosine-uridine nucleoside N-ribohydrolase
MGGVARSIDRLDLPYAEHNIKCDPEAAHIVFACGIPMTVVPLDLTTQVRITREGVARIRAGGTPFHEAVATQLEHYPRIQSEGFTNMHDPLAVASIIDPTFIKTAPVHVDVELGGEYAIGATLMKADPTSPIQMGISVDIARFEEFLVSRIESQPA